MDEKKASEAQLAKALTSSAETSPTVVNESSESQVYTKIRGIENATVLQVVVDAIAEGNDLQSAAQEYLILSLW